MAEEEASEKSHAASPERLRKARREGNVPSSPEIQTVARYGGMLVATALFGGGFAVYGSSSLTGFLARPEKAGAFLLGGGDPLALIGPVASVLFAAFMLPMALVFAGLIVQGALVFAPKKIMPKLERLSPVKNAGQKFGPAGLGEFARSSIKFVAFASAGVLIGIALLPRYLGATGGAAGRLGLELGNALTSLLLAAACLSAVAAAVDYPLRRMRHEKQLRMSRQEVVEETKETEGNPEQKQARRRKAQEIAGLAQLKEVPNAAVVITNPEHYAVALSWNRDAGEVPRCIAKGADGVALMIKRRAKEAGVPVREDPPTARALHATVEVGEPIRREQFAAVAAAIRFADRVRERSGKKG